VPPTLLGDAYFYLDKQRGQDRDTSAQRSKREILHTGNTTHMQAAVSRRSSVQEGASVWLMCGGIVRRNRVGISELGPRAMA
jgi:hypothetical protein